MGRTVLEVMPGTGRCRIEIYGTVALTGEPAFSENYAAELQRYFEVSAFRPDPNQFACSFFDITVGPAQTCSRNVNANRALVHALRRQWRNFSHARGNAS